MSDQRFNTGNPIGSNSPLDRSDNTRNLDVAVNAPQDTFQDRLGKSRLTWAGVVKAGSGDPAIAVDAAATAVDGAARAESAASQVQQDADQIAADAAQQAVTDVVVAVDGAVDRAEDAASRSETASNNAFINADVYPDVASGRAAVAIGEQFQVLSADGTEYTRYRKDSASAQTEVGRFPSSGAFISVRNAVTWIDVSAISNNYDLTFQEAISLVPLEFRKQGIEIEYNGTERRVFLAPYSAARWLLPERWLRPLNPLAEGKINLADGRMIYRGWTIHGNSPAEYHPDNAILIVPIHRSYNESGAVNPLDLNTYPKLLSVEEGNLYRGWLTSQGVRAGSRIVNSIGGFANLGTLTIPENAAYHWVSLTRRTPEGVLIGPGNIEIAEQYVRYFREPSISSSAIASQTLSTDGFDSVQFGIHPGLTVERSPGGTKAITPYFKSNLRTIGGLHISQIVKHVEVQKGHRSLISNLTGQPRRFCIDKISMGSSGSFVDAFIWCETEDGVLQGSLPGAAPIDADGYAHISWSRSQDTDPVRLNITVDCNYLRAGQAVSFGEAGGEIHPSVVEKGGRVLRVNKGAVFTEFTDYGISRVSSNMALPAPFPIQLDKRMVNGNALTGIVGDPAIDHQQTTLVCSKLSRFYGKASIYAQGEADYPGNPHMGVIRDTTSTSGHAGNASNSGLVGENESQWIHPDICYAPDSPGGYPYWMINSVFPNGNDRKEDADLLVSSDGIDWKRVRGFYEGDGAGIPFRTPEVFWDSNYKNAFLPIPINGNTFEFATETEISDRTITAYLNHDPAISYHDGYVNVYITYNLGFTSPITHQHKYRICLRTANGTDWEIMREDGSSMPYNEVNSQLIFTKTNGVRNHIQYLPGTGVGGDEVSPQVVMVSNDEWYLYSRQIAAPASGVAMNMIRYRGTSPYTFDFSSREVMSKSSSAGGALWHMCVRYYGGLFYTMTNGFMFTSTDGVSFTTSQYPFFWRGMGSDIYKPSFVVGHDGKIKIAYGITYFAGIPHPFAVQKISAIKTSSDMYERVGIMATLVCEYSSLTDIMGRSQNPTADAYVDVVVMVISQRTKTTQIRLLPCLRSLAQLDESVEVSYDDEIYVMAYLNARNGGRLNFGGVSVTLPGAAFD